MVHSTQGKPGKSRKFLGKSQHSGKTQGKFLNFHSTCWYYNIMWFIHCTKNEVFH